jgi:hypothetical protein
MCRLQRLFPECQSSNEETGIQKPITKARKLESTKRARGVYVTPSSFVFSSFRAFVMMVLDLEFIRGGLIFVSVCLPLSRVLEEKGIWTISRRTFLNRG